MTVINGKLIEKKLVLEKVDTNQGEAGSVQLEISLEPIQNIKYYLEFLCPYGRKYLSQEVGVENSKISYLMPTCVFLVAGKVYVQLIARDSNSIIIKSTKSSDASIEIKPSINGIDNSQIEHEDFVSHAERVMANANEVVDLMQQNISLVQQKQIEIGTLIDNIQQKLIEGKLEGKDAYFYALEHGFEGTEQEFGEKLAKVGDIVEDAPDNKAYARQKGNWVQMAEIPLPNMQSVGKVVAVAEGEQGAEYKLMPITDNYYTLDIDQKEIESFARHNPTVYRCKKIVSADKDLDGKEGIFEVSFVFLGTHITQKILDTSTTLLYVRTKSEEGVYSKPYMEVIKPMSIENLLIEPTAFVKTGYFYSASINLFNYLGYDISNNTVPMLVLARASQMVAYECNLSKDIELVDNVLKLRAGSRPSTELQGNLLLLGVG